MNTVRRISIIFLIDLVVEPHHCISANIKTDTHAFENFKVSRLNFKTIDAASGLLSSNLGMSAFMCSNETNNLYRRDLIKKSDSLKLYYMAYASETDLVKGWLAGWLE